MRYVQYLNSIIKNEVNNLENFIMFGQNISAGSCLGGLTRDISPNQTLSIYNTTNTENALVGMGFGLMLSGTNSVYFMKQQDFLLLGLDHLRNTNNFARQSKLVASFTVFCVVMDAGYEGIQASLNNLTDFCALSGCEGYSISTKQEADFLIRHSFATTGFKIICVSQRMYGQEILDFENPTYCDDFIWKYKDGEDLTIACFNFSLLQGKKMREELNEIGIKASLYNISSVSCTTYDVILINALSTGRLLILDDAKTSSSVSNLLEIAALRAEIKEVYSAKRGCYDEILGPNPDEYIVEIDAVINNLNL
jgi:pyruvate/2-oxoglutarate/acetoin dehydrogenase E1 component